MHAAFWGACSGLEVIGACNMFGHHHRCMKQHFVYHRCIQYFGGVIGVYCTRLELHMCTAVLGIVGNATKMLSKVGNSLGF